MLTHCRDYYIKKLLQLVEFDLETKEAQEWCDSAAVARSSSCQTDIVSTRDIGSTESDKRGNSEAEF